MDVISERKPHALRSDAGKVKIMSYDNSKNCNVSSPPPGSPVSDPKNKNLLPLLSQMDARTENRNFLVRTWLSRLFHQQGRMI